MDKLPRILVVETVLLKKVYIYCKIEKLLDLDRSS